MLKLLGRSQVAVAFGLALSALLMSDPARAAGQGQMVPKAAMDAASVADDEAFGVSLAVNGRRLVVFINASATGKSWRPAASELVKTTAPTIDDALTAFAVHHPELKAVRNEAGVMMSELPPDHCASAVLGQTVDDWTFAGTFREFENAFDRQVHRLGNVEEGRPIGPRPPADSPMLAPIVIGPGSRSALTIWLEALRQLDGVVVMFREAAGPGGELQCMRETYVRDATITTFIGYSRNQALFVRPPPR